MDWDLRKREDGDGLVVGVGVAVKLYSESKISEGFR